MRGSDTEWLGMNIIHLHSYCGEEVESIVKKQVDGVQIAGTNLKNSFGKPLKYP
jgi:hypothetical protein